MWWQHTIWRWFVLRLLILSARSWRRLCGDLCRKSQNFQLGRASVNVVNTLRSQREAAEVWDGANGQVVWGEWTRNSCLLITHFEYGRSSLQLSLPSQEATNLALAAFHLQLSSPNYANGIELKYLFRRPDGPPTWAGLATTEGADEDWRCIVSSGTERPEIGVFPCPPDAEGIIRAGQVQREYKISPERPKPLDKKVTNPQSGFFGQPKYKIPSKRLSGSGPPIWPTCVVSSESTSPPTVPLWSIIIILIRYVVVVWWIRPPHWLILKAFYKRWPISGGCLNTTIRSRSPAEGSQMLHLTDKRGKPVQPMYT